MFLGTGQFGDADRVATKHLRRNVSWMILEPRDRSRNNKTSFGDKLSSKMSSSSRCVTPRRQIGGVGIHSKKILWPELRVVGQDLLLGCPARQPLQNLLDGDPVTANARLPEPHVVIDCDPLKE
jgi:hypothetical protein